MFIYPKYNPEVIDKLFQRQAKANREQWKDPYTFLLFDDCLSDAKGWGKDEHIKEIFFNGRHYKILFILTMQSPMQIGPALRTNIDFTFILKNNNSNDREKIYKNYAGVFPTMEIFNLVLDACTEDHHCLVIDNTTHSNKLEDQVFIYKASDHGDFRVCSDSAWKINNEKFYKNIGNGLGDNDNKKEFVTKNKKKFTLNKKVK
jgi:hypothetical protein